MLLYLACFLSGMAALLFETLWFRLAALVFGNTVWASSVVLASFMGGLAVGSLAASSRGRRLRRPLRAYAALEIAVAASGLALVLLLPALSDALAPVFRRLVERAALLHLLRLGLGFGLLLVPAAAMGATLPVLVKAVVARGAGFGPALGALYGWNTFGAVAGALAGELLLIGGLGLRGTGVTAALLDLTAAAVAYRLSLAAGELPTPAGTAPPRATAPVSLLTAAALAGGLLLALEVVWFRLLAQFVMSTALTFAVLLAVVLAGIAGGGWLGGAWLRRSPEAWRSTAVVALVAGIATMSAYAWLTRGFASMDVAHSPGAVALRAFPLMFPTSLLSGALFTLMGGALRRELDDDSFAAGLLTLSNTLGALLGSVAGGFLLLPLWGVERSLGALAAGYALVALAAALRARPRRAPFAFAAALFVVATTTLPRDAGYRAAVEKRWSRDGSRPLAWREGLTTSLLYTVRPLFGEPLDFRLVTNGYSMAATHNGARRYMKAFVYWPVAFHPAPRRALLISFGTGSTAAALRDTAELRSIDVVDVAPEVLEMGRLIAPAGRPYALDDARARVHVEDGRFFLLASATQYDLITAEPPPPKLAGVVDLYTREYFTLLKARLAPGGIVSYWLPVMELQASDTRAIVAGFCAAFEDCSLWNGQGFNWMLVGSRGASYAPGGQRLARQWDDPALAAELRALGFDTPAELLATFMADAPQLALWTHGTPPLTDDRPHRISPRVVPGLEAARQHADLMDAGAARARFERSPWPARIEPAELRDRVGAAFELQGLVNRAELREYGLPVPGRFRDLAAGLTRGTSPWLALRLLGSDPDQQALAERAAARGETGSNLDFLRAAGAAASRDYATAERLLGEVLARNPGQPFLRSLQAQLLCLSGREDAARALVSGAATPDADLREWARESCGPS